MRLPKEFVHTMRGKKRSQPQVREHGLCTTRLVTVQTSKNPFEQERLEVHLEVMPSTMEELGGYGEPLAPPEGVTSFLHIGFLVFDESLVWSYAHLEKPDEPRGNFCHLGQALLALVHCVCNDHDYEVYGEKAERVEDKHHGFLYEQAHASFGSARLYRGEASRGGVFYGSKVSHGHSMSLRISRDASRRDSYRDWRSPSEELIEIEMSVAQFGELLTNQHEGIGVPVTIRAVLGKDMPPVPPLPGLKEIIQEDVRDLAAELAKELDTLKAEILAAEPKLGKKRTDDFVRHLERSRATMTEGLPTLHKQFIKSCEKTIQDARATFEAGFRLQAQNVGNQVMAGKKTIEIEEFKAPTLLGLQNSEALPPGKGDKES